MRFVSKECTHFITSPLYRPDISRTQWRRLPPLPLAIALVPLKCSYRNLQFPHRVPFAKDKTPWCPCPFKNEAYSPNSIIAALAHTQAKLNKLMLTRLKLLVKLTCTTSDWYPAHFCLAEHCLLGTEPRSYNSAL